MDKYIRKSGMSDIKIEPPTSPSPHLEVESVKNANRILHFQMITLSCKVFFPINNFQRQSCSSKCLEGNRENIFEATHKYVLLRFPCTPRYGAMFQTLYFRNGCIGLHVRYTVEKLIGGTFISRKGAISTRRALV